MAAQPVPPTPTAATIQACAASIQGYLQQMLGAGSAQAGVGNAGRQLLCNLCVDLGKMCGYINGLAAAPTGSDKTAAVALQAQANLLAAALGGQRAP